MQSMFAEKKVNKASMAVANQTTAQGKRMPAVPVLQKKAAGLEDDTLQGKFNPIQKMGPHEEEEPVQGKFDPVQKVEEEELPAQGKFNPIQKVGGPEEEELPIQGKFDSIQRVEEEEPLQGRFNPIQKVGGSEEEELPIQAKFDPIQKVEEEELLQGRFNPIQKVGGPEEEEPIQGKFNPIQKAGVPEEELPVQGKFNPIQKKENKTGLPDNLKSGVENLSGVDISDVKVHYNSSQPAQLNALAYAQGTDIHVAPGQEKHLAHEAWHVVQQKQGRVQATKQMKEGVPVNDDKGLETEADVMGAKAAAFTSGSESSTTQYKLSNSSATLQRVIQRAAVSIGEAYYNGSKIIYTIEGKDGFYFKKSSNNGMVSYKKLSDTGANAQNGQRKYVAVDPEVIEILDERTAQQKWQATLGGDFGANYIMMPNMNYPHMSVAYTATAAAITLGNAHYSRRADDPRRLAYNWNGHGWTYDPDTHGMDHVNTKAVADGIIASMEAYINPA